MATRNVLRLGVTKLGRRWDETHPRVDRLNQAVIDQSLYPQKTVRVASPHSTNHSHDENSIWHGWDWGRNARMSNLPVSAFIFKLYDDAAAAAVSLQADPFSRRRRRRELIVMFN
jgi:hypothetical protein